MVSENEQLLNAIEVLFSATQEKEEINLTSEQIEMLQMSEVDIKEDRLISEKDLMKQDDEWMK
ncbi:hypothetical protein [Salinimicrobium sediminilitoris]|uniref:hypothetical protein n=1 Tax=Salinimicrobium sediminilitoris TaxID=2876715 RepID=UPI001E47CFB9|nr:hypothetical protein [Salinimicrobium sediminilitoris]MCC8361078.1 hypothetical protein [Salinimicrobium sediminilitoris]